MAFDQQTRNRLARFVSDARKLLSDEFTRQLQNDHGLNPATGEAAGLDKLPFLNDTQRETARLLRVTLDHYLAGSGDATAKARRDTLDRIVREQAFTVLNRLCALRMAEARGLLVESIGRGYQSKGFQLYARLAGAGLGETGDAYRSYLFSVFDEFAVDLPVLFDRYSPQGRLFPREAALLTLLDLINHADINPLWAEDETIGWIYQYFNSKEERKAMRDASQAPRNSRELAVRNQFFTPRYVVEFLTDNTLGRIWYEMTQGETGLKDACRYLVRRPNEIFLSEGVPAPLPASGERLGEGPEAELTQEELLKQPVFIPHRPIKDPRELKMLDPACGSMHFGLYAFDLFERIYEEAWDREAAAGEGRLIADFPDREAFLREVPRLIIEHNIHGIDIDPRAVQIAGLSLWLRAQKRWHDLGVRAGDRPRIRRSNVVCAEPMPGETALLDEFIKQSLSDSSEDRAVAGIVRRVFEAMALAGEAGSLLKIEEEIAGAIEEARQQWLAARTQPRQAALLREAETPYQTSLGIDVRGIADEAFWAQAEGRIYDALRAYAEQAEGDAQRRLFADDAARGFAFIDLCRQRYDVVLMNPPFGESAPAADFYLRGRYPDGYIDLYTSFVDRGCQITSSDGLTGAITSRTAFTLSSFSNWRTNRLLGETVIDVCIDLGVGVLDSAMVETAAYVVSWITNKASIFFDLDKTIDKDAELLKSIACPSQKNVYCIQPEDLKEIPFSPIAYFLEPELRLDFHLFKPLSHHAAILGGNATGDDERFIRCFWEVKPIDLMPSNKRLWRWISKGGEYSLFYSSIHLVIDWHDDGGYLGEYLYLDRPRNGYLWGPKSWSAEHMGNSGVVWSLRSQKGISFRVLPRDCAMSGKSAIATLHDKNIDLGLLGILNTEHIFQLAKCLSTFGSYEKGAIGSLPIDLTSIDRFTPSAKSAFESARSSYSFFETDPHHSAFAPKNHQSIKSLIKSISDDVLENAELLYNELENINSMYRGSKHFVPPSRIAFIKELRNQLDTGDILSEYLGSVLGRWDIRYATGEKPAPALPDPFDPLPVCPPGMLQNAQGLPAAPADVPADYPLRISWGGILCDDAGHPEDIESRVRDALRVIWGERADAIEQEACDILGVKALRDYFRKPALFFADHLKRYSKSRRQAPIYWPLSTPSGSYTLWLYYHRLSDQTLYHCVNDFVEPKLRAVSAECSALSKKGGRSAKEERELEQLTALAGELAAFRDELLRVAAFWKPNLNDGVQITAAPLWRLFGHKPWQKKLRETWEALEAGAYDWAHLAYSIWPARVREKCKADKSLAIAHDLEHVYVEPPTSAKKKPARKKKETLTEDMFEDDADT